jgi:hypothetical protein
MGLYGLRMVWPFVEFYLDSQIQEVVEFSSFLFFCLAPSFLITFP